MSEWKTIDSAPRDGSRFLAWNEVVGCYTTALITNWEGTPEGIGKYEGFPCGFWNAGNGSYPFGKWDCRPTHWMALPEPPK